MIFQGFPDKEESEPASPAFVMSQSRCPGLALVGAQRVAWMSLLCRRAGLLLPHLTRVSGSDQDAQAPGLLGAGVEIAPGSSALHRLNRFFATEFQGPAGRGVLSLFLLLLLPRLCPVSFPTFTPVSFPPRRLSLRRLCSLHAGAKELVLWNCGVGEGS